MVQYLLNEFRDREALDTLNEFAFKVKSKLETDDDMPARDCTAIVIDTEAEMMKVIPSSR